MTQLKLAWQTSEALLPNLAQWSTITAQEAQIDYSVNVKATLEQSLTAAGEGGPLYFMATFSDDSTQYLTKDVGINASISTADCYDNDGVVTSCANSMKIVAEQDVINAYVAPNAVSMSTGSVITAQWANICNNQVIYSGVGNADDFIVTGFGIFVNADTRYITDS